MIKETIKIWFFISVIFYLPLYFYFCLSSRIYDIPSFLYTFVRWDSGWYLAIAESGYPDFFARDIIRGDLVYIWPPLYPLILKITILISPFKIGVSVFILQNLTIFGVIYTTLKLFNLFMDFKSSIKITTLYLMFPISIFLNSAYSEGLFIILMNTFLYYLIKNEYLKAVLWVSLLPIIRYTGLFSIFLINFFFMYFLFRQKKYFKIILLNIIFLIPFIFWLLFNFSKTGDPLFFLKVQSSLIAFTEWGKFQGLFYSYFLQWLSMIFNDRPYWIEYRLGGFFVLLYIAMNILTLKIKNIKKTLKVSLKAISYFGILLAVYPFTTGIESLWRYGYSFPPEFIFLKRFINNDKLYNFILILFACLKITFGIAFISSLHIT